MKILRQILLLGSVMMALVTTAQQTDPVISSINDAYQQAKESMKKNKSLGNEMVTTFDYTIRGKGKTTETLHFYYNTVQGTYMFAEDGDPHFFYHPLFFITRNYNIGNKKYQEEYLFDSSSQRLLFASTQDYDENGKRFERRFYYHDGSLYHVIGPATTAFMEDNVVYQANELRMAFDWLIQNPKE